MIITDEKLKGSIEDKMAIADSFNLMDDDFFAVVMRDKAACSYTLSRLLDKKLSVIKVDTQYAIRNYNGHSVVLDALAEDEEHKLYNIEVQVKNKDYHPKRVRYYQASLDTLFLEKNQNYKELPELYLIFISATDWLKGGKCKYTVRRMVDETHQEIDNGVHEYYFNAAVDDGSSLAKLLQYLKNSSADNSSFGELSKAVYNHKRTTKGADSMCEAVENYGYRKEAEGRVEGRAYEIIALMLETGADDEAIIARLMSRLEISKERAIEYYNAYKKQEGKAEK